MKAMIFAAGLGTRLKPLTDRIPKALVPLAGKPLLCWQLDKLVDAGIRDIVVNVHHLPEQIIEYLSEQCPKGCRVQISDERNLLLDTGGGLKKALTLLGDAREPVLACNVDILSNIDLKALIHQYEMTSESLLVVSDRITQRYLCFDSEDCLCGWTNLKTGEIKQKDGRHLAFSGMQILSVEALQRLREMPDMVFSMIDFYLSQCQTLRLHAYVPSDYRIMDVGKIEHLQDAEEFALSLG
ncbi:MAG: nucleotidyltransferase family protein [Paludibacteraceae bacterium]|nr:nucleotidyltransferase family protein [Paludibacteraceae bacterium]